MKVLIKIVLTFTLIISSANANENNESNRLINTDRFVPFEEETSYLILQDTGGDERSWEGRYAFEYILYNCELGNKKGNICKKRPDLFEFTFSYVGEFDFYALTRYSGPVINRISNPAFNIRYKPNKESWPSDYLTLYMFGVSAEHRSNGQVTSVYDKDTDVNSTTSGQYNTQIAYENNDRYYFDGISRGADYVTAKLNIQIGKNSATKESCNSNIGCFDVGLSYKYYIHDNNDITWGELVGSDTGVEDYDIFRVKVINMFKTPLPFLVNHKTTLELDYTVGKKGLKTDSYDVSITVPVQFFGLKLPMYARFHNGPMDRLSDYTKEYNSLGIGLVFTHK